MKNIKFSRRQILRTIRAACIALFFAACAGRAEAQLYSADFVVNGSNVTVAGSPNNTTSAYFVDVNPNTYAFTISSAADIGNTSNAFHLGNLISFDNGSVNNAGTLTASNYAITINSTTATSNVTNSGSIYAGTGAGVYIAGNGTVSNSGLITSTSAYGVKIAGTGTVNNAAGASIFGSTVAGDDSAIILGNGTVNNAGTVSGYYSGVHVYGNGTVNNATTGSISGAYQDGVQIEGDGTVNNAGSISGYYAGVYIHGAGGMSSVTNSASGTISGTNSSTYAAGVGFGGTNSSYGSSSFSLVNYGTITGSATYSGYYDDVNAYGVNARSYSGNINISNGGGGVISGSATVSGDYTATASGIYASSIYGNITVTNNGTATGTASARYAGSASGYGITSGSEYGNVIVTNNGTATGTGTATGSGGYTGSGYGISVGSYEGNVTVVNNGTATGSGYSLVNGSSSNTATGYGISASSYYGTVKIVNNGTATGTGSGYYAGTGYGLYGRTTEGAIYITNNNTATGTGTASGSDYTPTGTGYGIYAISDSGYISILNNCAAIGTGTANVSGDSASGYGYGIFAQTADGYISIQNCGQAIGTGSGYYYGTGSGIYALATDEGTINIVNDGIAIGTGTSYSSYYEDPAYGYGIYAKSNGPITINNLCNAVGNAISGIEVDGTITAYSTESAYGSGINVRSSGSGSIVINNSGSALGFGTVWGSGSGYGYGINVKSSGSAYVTINNSGVVGGTGSSYAGTGSGYGIYFQGDGSGPLTITNAVSGVIAGLGLTAFGSTSAYGIYLQNGSGPATITNSGVIAGIGTGSGVYGVGIYAHGYTGSITVNEFGGAVTTGIFSTTGSGAYVGGPVPAILLGSGVNTVNIVGQANNTSYIDGGSSGSNTLTMHLAGMTPAQKAALITAVAATQGGGYSGPIFAGGVTYAWVDFNSVAGSFVSLEQAVDPGLMNVATKIDNLPSYLGVAYGPFYVAAANNPEAALNSLVGREFDDALGVISKNDATALSETFDSRAFDLRAGTGGFDLSGLSITSGSMIASLGQTSNTLDRLMGASALGGTKMSDSKEVIAPAANTNRWGAWASGTVTLADESATDSGPGFHYTTGSPTIGADYRVCNHFALGALFNYSTTGANFGDGSRLGVETELGALYGTWSDGPWYVNGLAGGGYSSYDNRRVTLTGDTASSSPDGDEILANLTGGYDFKLGGGWTVSPEGGFLYTHVTENGYTESGAGAYDLTLNDQDIDSLRSKLGFRVMDNFKWDGIEFTPQIRASWYHEILDDSRGVTTNLGAAPALGSFTVQTNTEGRDFADLGAGLSATPAELSGDVTFFVNYDAQVGQDNFIAHTVNGGLRVNF